MSQYAPTDGGEQSATDPGWQSSPCAIFAIFLRLGLTSFGGPIAHPGYSRAEFVTRRRWLSEQGYADLAALCQFLPGPASSQAGMALGLCRGGNAGTFAAWAGFTLPSAIILILFALGISQYGSAIPPGALHGLKVVAAAVVAQAVWNMARNLCTDTPRVTIMAMATCAALLAPTTMTDKDLYGGLIRLHILHHADEESIFGLGIIEELRRHGYEMSAGTLYPMLHGLEKKGYLTSRRERSGRVERRVYEITKQGRRALKNARVKVRELFGELIEVR